MRIFLRILVKCLGSLPVAARSALGRILGYCFFLIPTRERRIARLQLNWMLGDEKPLPEVYMSLGQTLLESLNLRPMLVRSAGYVECPDMELYHDLISRKRGIIALTAHTGNWDLLAAYMIKLGAPLATVGREARIPVLQEVLSGLRSGYGIKTIWRSGHTGLREIKAELAHGHVVAALIDQDTRVKSVYSPFFGVPAKTPVALVEIGRRYQALFMACFIFRTGFNRYQARIFELPGDLPAPEILHEYHRLLERLIREHPGQWVWFHKRWRSLPDGATLSSRSYIAFLEERLAERGGAVVHS